MTKSPRPKQKTKMFECFDFFKEVGQICGEIPFNITIAGNWPFLAVAVQKSFHIYSCEELKIQMVSSPQPKSITCIAADPTYVYTSTETTLRCTDRVRNEVTEIEIGEPITTIVPLNYFIVAVHGTKFTSYSVPDLEVGFDIDLEQKITAICHPLTFQNKFLIAVEDGSILLWNVHHNQLIYKFEGFGCVCTQIKQSTHQEVCAFALTDGRIVFHNIVSDEFLFGIQHPSPIRDFSFRTDSNSPHIAVGLENGSLLVWDLNEKQIIASDSRAHNGPITSVSFLKNKNMLITGGCDNAIRQWVLDINTTNILRVERCRVGHEKPPKAICFTEVNGATQLVTASDNATIIASNPIIETTSSLLSIAPLNNRYLTNPIRSLSSTNAHRYVSIASQHEGGTLVFLWDIENNRFARRALTSMPKNGPKIDDTQTISFADFNGENKATCVCLTRCGNFGIVGSDHGNVEVFVTQSARHKGSLEQSHESPVVFVHVDAINSQITSGSEDGQVFFHNFEDRSFQGSINLPAPVTNMAVHPNSQLLAVACNEKVIIFDCQSRMIAREFDVQAEHMGFSHNGKYLFVASRTPNVYLFDMITACLIESVELDSPVTGIAADPSGELIATLHEDNISTKLWYFRPQKIKSVQAFDVVSEAKQEGLAIYSDQPLLKLKNLIEPPTDALQFAKTKQIVPFFLSASDNATNVVEEANILSITSDIIPSTDFIASLLEDSLSGNYDKSIQKICTLSYEEISIEISALTVNEKEVDERLIFMEMLIYALSKRTNFELIQAIMNVFLKEFGVKIIENQALKDKLEELKEAQTNAIKFLEDDVTQSLYLIQLISKIQ